MYNPAVNPCIISRSLMKSAIFLSLYKRPDFLASIEMQDALWFCWIARSSAMFMSAGVLESVIKATVLFTIPHAILPHGNNTGALLIHFSQN